MFFFVDCMKINIFIHRQAIYWIFTNIIDSFKITFYKPERLISVAKIINFDSLYNGLTATKQDCR